ncbi:MAG: hypothetical protein ACR5LA_11135 [Wolbachia sp.]
MIANINTIALQGISTVSVNAQIHMANGIPAFNIVGLPDKTVAESIANPRKVYLNAEKRNRWQN